MPELDLQAIRERVEAATPGPWDVAVEPEYRSFDVVEPAYLDGVRPTADAAGWIFRFDDDYGPDMPVNARFIAHARTDIPLLLEEIERLRAVTPEQVEAAAAAILEVKTEHGDAYYRMARAALLEARHV